MLEILKESYNDGWKMDKKEMELKETEQMKQQKTKEIITQWEKESKKLENEIKINQDIDKCFDDFRFDLLTNWEADYKLRKKRNLSIEKKEDWKINLNSYGETCEIDLKTGQISYIKEWQPIIVQRNFKQILDITAENPTIATTNLYQAFWQMNIINRVMSEYKKQFFRKKDFKFRHVHYIDHKESFLLDAGPRQAIISFEWLKKRFGNDITKKEILDMFNKLALS